MKKWHTKLIDGNYYHQHNLTTQSNGVNVTPNLENPNYLSPVPCKLNLQSNGNQSFLSGLKVESNLNQPRPASVVAF